jgi:Arc/MetJ-type ribon-helix-helix transcriptional regulator
MASNTSSVRLSTEAQEILQDLISSGAGANDSEVIERLLTVILPSYRQQHKTLQQMALDAPATRPTGGVPGLYVTPVLTGRGGPQTWPYQSFQPVTSSSSAPCTDASICTTAHASVLNPSMGTACCQHSHNVTGLSHPAPVTMEESANASTEPDDSDEFENAEIEAALDNEGLQNGARKRFFKSIYQLDPSARRKRKAKFCRSLVGLMQLYGMDAPYVADVVKQMASDAAVLEKHQTKRAELIQEVKAGRPSQLAKAMVSAATVLGDKGAPPAGGKPEDASGAAPVPPAPVAVIRRSNRKAKGRSGSASEAPGDEIAPAVPQIIGQKRPRAAIEGEEATTWPANPAGPRTFDSPRSNEAEVVTAAPVPPAPAPLARPMAVEYDWALFLDDSQMLQSGDTSMLQGIASVRLGSAVRGPRIASPQLAAAGTAPTPRQRELLSSPTDSVGIHLTSRSSVYLHGAGHDVSHPAPSPLLSRALPAWATDDEEYDHAFGPDFGFDLGFVDPL